MDLRDFINRCEEAGELKRITAEVDWNLELSHISKLTEERKGPALLFENIKGYDSPVFTGAFATESRLAMSMVMNPGNSLCDSAKEWMEKTIDELIPSKEVSEGPILENIVSGDDVDLNIFPVPHFFPQDGGRYIGTATFLVIKDPETGKVNLGTYRMQMLDGKRCGVQILPGKRGMRILEKYRKLGQKMPAAAVIGCDPLMMMAGALQHEGAQNQYDIIGSVRGAPSEYMLAPLTGLPIPAAAEIVLEGEIDPNNFQPEGPFGEYTGYYTDELYKEIKKPCLEVKQILHRDKPILWATSVGRPVTDVHMLISFTRTAMLWSDLAKMSIPGIQSVNVMPESAGRFWAVVSVKTQYPGHSSQVGNAVIATTTGSYGIKGVIVVDEDIDADDIQRVFWALACRYDPERGTEMIKRGRATPLDPALDPNQSKLITSRIILDATIPYEWDEKPVPISLDEETLAKVKSRWSEYGID